MRMGVNGGAESGVALLPSKVTVPALPANAVDRPQVLAKLARALEVPLTSVVSSAGFGKTTSVLSWASALEGVPLAWCRVEAEDASPERFWLYLAAALRMADERICMGLDEVRIADGFENARPTLDALVLQMAEFGRDFVCVLEDFHEVQACGAVRQGMLYLVRHAPANAHFVITSRQALGFPTSKMKVAGELVEVTEADLRFSVEETEALFSGMGVRLAREEARAVHEGTRGWAAGGKLVALLCGDGSKVEVDRALCRARSSISDYLFEEVFSVLGEDRQRFLVATSVVGSFCLPLAERITGLSRAQTAEQIDFLVTNNLFIERFERKNGEDWYRYHPLLSDLLHQRLARLDGERADGLRSAARDWLEENGHFDEAVKASAELGDWEGVRRVIVRNWIQLYMSDNHYVLVRWAACLPRGELMRSPLVCAALSMPYALCGSFELGEACLKNAIDHLQDGREDFLFALCLAQKAFISSFRGLNDEMRSYAGKALAYLPEQERYLRGMMLQVMAGSRIDEPLEAKVLFERAVGEQRGYGNGNLFCSAYSNLALICANLGYVDEASFWAEQAMGLYDERERPFKPMLAFAFLALMICRYERGEFEQVVHLHGVLDSVSAEGVLPSCRAEAEALKAKALVRLGRDEGCQAFFRALDGSEDGALAAFPTLGMARAYCAAFRTRALERCENLEGRTQTVLFNSMVVCCLAPERFEEACARLESVDSEERAAHVRALVLAAVLHERSARHSRAANCLARAARLAREHGLAEALAENAVDLRPAVARLSSDEDPGLCAWLRGVLDADAKCSVDVRLTDRELDVMRCVSAGDTVAQTAQRLFVSRDTVKKHLANVYAKLGAHSKMQAVAILRDKGVL